MNLEEVLWEGAGVLWDRLKKRQEQGCFCKQGRILMGKLHITREKWLYATLRR